MNRFNLDDYAPVEERIGLFYADCPDGRIFTAIERLDPPLVVFRAEVYRDKNDALPWATGYAYEKEGQGHVNQTSYVENCETSAIGRALANAGYHGKRDGAPRPSREEMQKVERMQGLVGEAPQGHVSTVERERRNGNGAFSLQSLVPVGKHKGKTWATLVELQPDYVEWAIKNLSRLGEEGRRVLQEALDQEGAPDIAYGTRRDVPLSEPDDTLPF